jgi:hypothetical protein
MQRRLLDHVVGSHEWFVRHREAEHPSGLGMSKFMLCLAAATLSNVAQAASVPEFAPNPAVSWIALYNEFRPPPSGPGPVLQDPAHPRVTNAEFRRTGRLRRHQRPSMPLHRRAPRPRKRAGLCHRLADQRIPGGPVVAAAGHPITLNARSEVLVPGLSGAPA